MDAELLNTEPRDPNYLRRRIRDRRGHKADTGDGARYLRISKDEYEDGTENEALERQRAPPAARPHRRPQDRPLVRAPGYLGLETPKKVRPGYRSG